MARKGKTKRLNSAYHTALRFSGIESDGGVIQMFGNTYEELLNRMYQAGFEQHYLRIDAIGDKIIEHTDENYMEVLYCESVYHWNLKPEFARWNGDEWIAVNYVRATA